MENRNYPSIVEIGHHRPNPKARKGLHFAPANFAHVSSLEGVWKNPPVAGHLLDPKHELFTYKQLQLYSFSRQYACVKKVLVRSSLSSPQKACFCTGVVWHSFTTLLLWNGLCLRRWYICLLPRLVSKCGVAENSEGYPRHSSLVHLQEAAIKPRNMRSNSVLN